MKKIKYILLAIFIFVLGYETKNFTMKKDVLKSDRIYILGEEYSCLNVKLLQEAKLMSKTFSE